MHDGRLQAASAGTGQGCEFVVRLPVLVRPNARDVRTELAPYETNTRALRVLVVEDNVDAGDSLSLLLRLYGHDVQLARTGQSALTMAPATRPEIILLDIGLPGMDGSEVAARLRAMPELEGVMLCALTGLHSQ
jgi:two-component system CheB/CheR fusion protein